MKAAKLARSKKTTELLVTFWPPDMEGSRYEKWGSACEHLRVFLASFECTVLSSVKVASDLTLGHVLARILQKSQKDELPAVHLIQNPGFFTMIPETLEDFSERKRGRSGGHKHEYHDVGTFFCQLDLHTEIGGLDTLHVLLDPPNLPESGLISFDAENQAIIKRNYRNIWKLGEYGSNHFAARGMLAIQSEYKNILMTQPGQRSRVVWFFLIQRRSLPSNSHLPIASNFQS